MLCSKENDVETVFFNNLKRLMMNFDALVLRSCATEFVYNSGYGIAASHDTHRNDALTT